MLTNNFYIIRTDAGEVIRDSQSMLKINVHSLENSTFQPNPSELQFYSTYPTVSMAFETVNIKDYLRPLVASALLWYAQHIGCPEMNFSSQIPNTILRAG